MGNPLVLLAMYGWIPVVLYLFIRYPAQKAAIAGFVLAWLFLPVASIKFPGIPPYNKISATCYGILIATYMYDSKRFDNFKFSWIDIPMAIWCFCPFITSNVNGLGPYDGFSSVQNQFATWGIPYYLGRIYLNNFAGQRKLATGIFLGGLIYVPLCWFESRTFSSLHVLVYGMDTGRDAAQSIRYGGYRPQVFMEHGLMLGVWMMTASLCGFTLWRRKIMKKAFGYPMGLMVNVVFITFIFARSTGAYMLFALTMGIMYLARWFKTGILMWMVVGLIYWYLYTNVVGTFPHKEITTTLGQIFNEDRVSSVAFRFDNEEILGAKARQQMLFGWGGFGRNRIFDEMGKDISVTDSLWIIVFGINGGVGLLSLFSSLLLPVIAFCIKFPARLWKTPLVAPAAALAASICAYSFDCVLNAMTNPIFIFASGGLAGLVVASPKERMKE